MTRQKWFVALGLVVLVMTCGVATETEARLASHRNLGAFTQASDVGTVRQKGAVTFNKKTGVYRIVGNGDDLWAGKDDFHFVHRKARGDTSIAATIAFVSGSTDPHSKAGVMIRQDLSPDSPYADIVLHQNGHVAMQYREVRGGDTYEIEALHTGEGRFQLERQGDYVFMSIADADGRMHHAGGGFHLTSIKTIMLASLCVPIAIRRPKPWIFPGFKSPSPRPCQL